MVLHMMVGPMWSYRNSHQMLFRSLLFRSRAIRDSKRSQAIGDISIIRPTIANRRGYSTAAFRPKVASQNVLLPASISLMQIAEDGEISASGERVAWLGIAALNCRRSSENTFMRHNCRSTATSPLKDHFRRGSRIVTRVHSVASRLRLHNQQVDTSIVSNRTLQRVRR